MTVLKHQETASRSKMVLAAAVCMLPGVTYGAMLSYIALALPFFTSPNNTTQIFMDQDQSSWFVSLNQPLRMIGTLMASFLNEHIGRKKALLISIITMILGATTCYVANSFLVLMVGTLVCGLGTGLTLSPSYTLLSEISLIKFRGSLGSMNTLTANCGYLYGLVIGMCVPVIYLPMVIIAPALLFLVVFWWIPESPIWLFKQGREDDAKSTLQWIRGKSYRIEPEIKEIEAVVTSHIQTQSRQSVFSREFLYPSMLISVLFFFQAFSGADTLSYFALLIFKDFAIEEKVVAILFQVMVTLGYLISPIIMARFDRRPQFITAVLVFSLSIACMGLQNLLPINAFTSYLPLVSLMVCGLSYGLGVGPVPFVLMSELFTTRFKSYGMAVAMAVRSMSVFFQLKVFGILTTMVGINVIFLVHSALLVLGAIFTFIAIPETRDRSLSELEQIFMKTNDLLVKPVMAAQQEKKIKPDFMNEKP